jgi:uncharacterized protein YndB with AHSA1/START domain
MESVTSAVSIERELAIAASPETIWQFLVDPDKAVLWMGQSVSLDARPGGEYRNEVIPGHVARGEFVELDPPHRLVHTWGWEPGAEGPNPVPPGSSTVEIELVADGDGTLLRFTHRDLPSKKAGESHEHGWDHYLERLAVAASGGDAGVDPWITGPMV